MIVVLRGTFIAEAMWQSSAISLLALFSLFVLFRVSVHRVALFYLFSVVFFLPSVKVSGLVSAWVRLSCNRGWIRGGVSSRAAINQSDQNHQVDNTKKPRRHCAPPHEDMEILEMKSCPEWGNR